MFYSFNYQIVHPFFCFSSLENTELHAASLVTERIRNISTLQHSKFFQGSIIPLIKKKIKI